MVVPPGGAPVRMYVLVDEYSMGDADPVTLTVTLNAPSPNVCPTGGSDFHRLPPKIEHGVGFGRVRVPYEVLDALKSRRESR